MNILTQIMPADPWYEPSEEAIDRTRTFIVGGIFPKVDVGDVSELPGFYVGPETPFVALCPACSISHDLDAFAELLNTHYDALSPEAPRMVAPAPCCKQDVDLLAFSFPCVVEDGRAADAQWAPYQAAGFSRFSFTLWDMEVPITASERNEIVRRLGCPIKLVRYEL